MRAKIIGGKRAGVLTGAVLLMGAGMLLLGCEATTSQGRAQGSPLGEYEGTAVLELYTSQGCSSCPPADRLAVELAKREDVVVLTTPVTYWDSLGWKDTLASEEFTRRQHEYASGRWRKIYTPQAVVGGISAVVGSSVGSVERALDWARREAYGGPNVEVVREGSQVVVRVGKGKLPREPMEVTYYCYPREVTVSVGRGENAGRTITYANPVKERRLLGVWTGESREYRTALTSSGCEEAAAVVQEAPLGKIWGAGKGSLLN